MNQGTQLSEYAPVKQRDDFAVQLKAAHKRPRDLRSGSFVSVYFINEKKAVGSTARPIIYRAAVDELSLSEGAYLMSNLRPKTTGLPFVVWISPKDGASHDVRVKVAYEPVTDKAEASVSVRGDVRVTWGKLRKPKEFELLKRWIELNRDVLVKFWDGEIQYSEDAIEQLQKIDDN